MPTSITDTEALIRDVDLKKLIEDLSGKFEPGYCPLCETQGIVIGKDEKRVRCTSCGFQGDSIGYAMQFFQCSRQRACQLLSEWLIKQGVWHQPQTTPTEADSLNAIGALIAARDSLQAAADKLLDAQHEIINRIILINKRIAEVRAATDKSKLEYVREAA